VHPAFVLRLGNLVLKDNVKLGPWVHVSSSLRHCGLAHVGESLAAHAEVAANYERGGHRFVDLDVLIVAEEIRLVARLRHTAIYRLRQA
jgi:acyl dehydratase